MILNVAMAKKSRPKERILDLVTCPPLVGKCCMLKLEQIRGRKEFGIYGALSPFGREMQSAKCPIW